MTLTDTGPLVAILNPDDDQHDRCVRVLPGLRLPLLTTVSVMTEAMHFLARERGWKGQQTLLRMAASGKLRVAAFEEEALKRIETLMERYQDTPMDFADASLVALAEDRRLTQVFTIDSHFRAYRLADRRAFRVVPDDD
jgi:uncharacterized protein